jgi:hypothetical protein
MARAELEKIWFPGHLKSILFWVWFVVLSNNYMFKT